MRIVRQSQRPQFNRSAWLLCRERDIALESGETLRRGCGRVGLVPGQAGWSCFYCGNYVYQKDLPLDVLWFHFKTAREYWRVMSQQDRHFVNGVPVTGPADALPAALKRDLMEVHPPKWFLYFVLYDEFEFKQYLERMGIDHEIR